MDQPNIRGGGRGGHQRGGFRGGLNSRGIGRPRPLGRYGGEKYFNGGRGQNYKTVICKFFQ